MDITLLDTITKKTVIVSGKDLWYWSEGEGSCDCNRSIALGIEDEIAQAYPRDVCFGNHRILAVDVSGDLCGITKAEALKLFNQEYPERLISKFISP